MKIEANGIIRYQNIDCLAADIIVSKNKKQKFHLKI